VNYAPKFLLPGSKKRPSSRSSDFTTGLLRSAPCSTPERSASACPVVSQKFCYQGITHPG